MLRSRRGYFDQLVADAPNGGVRAARTPRQIAWGPTRPVIMADDSPQPVSPPVAAAVESACAAGEPPVQPPAAPAPAALAPPVSPPARAAWDRLSALSTAPVRPVPPAPKQAAAQTIPLPARAATTPPSHIADAEAGQFRQAGVTIPKPLAPTRPPPAPTRPPPASPPGSSVQIGSIEIITAPPPPRAPASAPAGQPATAAARSDSPARRLSRPLISYSFGQG